MRSPGRRAEAGGAFRIMTRRTNRRHLMTNALGLTMTGSTMQHETTARNATPAGTAMPEAIVSVAFDDVNARPFARDDFGIVGVYDADWLVQPEFSMLLNNLAASPGAFTGGRFFGAFTAGTPELY